MSRRLACLSLLLLGACALRPRYEELTTRFVPQSPDTAEVLIQVVDRNDAPVPGARIELGDRYRYKTLTDKDGVFRLPLEKKYSEENALLVVVLPKGVKGYRLVQVGGQPLRDVAPPPATDEDVGDAGVTTM
ncbi:MAG: carboxypeptidase regulatory-like domain-containing protein [Archangiaceae bacterium]|nr:carboxypeptidase regulatory-like domain-containing protein [Archangiaceae bacterium]